MGQKTVKEDLVRYRNKGVPLVCVCTADEHALEERIPDWVEEAWKAKKKGGDGPPQPKFVGWDCVSGIYALTKNSSEAVAKMAGENDPAAVVNPVDALLAAKNLPTGSILVMRGGHKILDTWPAVQAISNLRNPFQADWRMLVLLGPDFQLPPEISSSMELLDEALPDEETREKIVTKFCEDNGQKKPEDLPRIVQATHGLPPFTVLQSTALSIVGGKIEVEALRKRWKQTVNAMKGLKVLPSGLTVADVGGLFGAIEFADLLMKGLDPPDCVVFIDEIEKSLAGASGPVADSSGVSQDLLQQVLSWMEDNEADGLIAVGPPGAGKSLFAKILGSIGGRPTIAFDLGGMKGSYVGQSEQNMRAGLRTLSSVARRTFWIATCNSLGMLPPELKRRFRFGTWFFDLPNEEEKPPIWKIHLKQNGISKGELPDDDGWTGADIRTCCVIAKRLGISPKEAATWVLPASRSMVAQLDNLRDQANGKWLSASQRGVYVKPDNRSSGGSTRRVDAT